MRIINRKFQKPWAILIIDISQFLEAIAVIDELSPINFSDKCCAEFLLCFDEFLNLSGALFVTCSDGHDTPNLRSAIPIRDTLKLG